MGSPSFALLCVCAGVVFSNGVSRTRGASISADSAIADEFAESRVSYAGYQLWRVIADDSVKKNELIYLRDESDISMWGGNQTALDILIHKDALNTVRKRLLSKDINFDVVLNDVQDAINEENIIEDEDEDGFTNRQGHKLTWRNYHQLDDIYGYLDYLKETYPSVCTLYTIGRSVHGKPIKVLKISNGNANNPAVWIDGGMHAREWISPASVTYIINKLVLERGKNLENIDWYILPVANPDGYEYSYKYDRLWRKNRARSGQCAGTDLNRNFGYKWGGKGSGKNPCQEIYAGTGPFSEPETAAIKKFITQTDAKWKGYMSFHSYGQYILFPWGYDRVITTDHKDLLAVAQKMRSAIQELDGLRFTIGPAGSTLYPASGGSDDWAKGQMGIKYAFTVELRDSGRYGFLLPAPYIEGAAKEAFATVKVLANAINDPIK